MGWDTAQLLTLFAASFSYWWVIIPAILIGTIVGAVPGFSAANTIIILLPMTLAMDVEAALIFMMALYCASQLGNGIPAILVNIPGTGGAAATTLDGYPMSKKGEAQQALLVCFVASVVGGVIGTALVLAFLPYLSQIGYLLHSVEMVVIMLFGLTLIAAIAANDMLKGLIAGLFGLLIIAKQRKALLALHGMMRESAGRKLYQALVVGDWVNDRQHVTPAACPCGSHSPSPQR